MPDALRYCERTLELPPCSALVFAQPGCNSEDKNSSVENFYQIGLETVKLRTTIEFLSHVSNFLPSPNLRTLSQHHLCLLSFESDLLGAVLRLSAHQGAAGLLGLVLDAQHHGRARLCGQCGVGAA